MNIKSIIPTLVLITIVLNVSARAQTAPAAVQTQSPDSLAAIPQWRGLNEGEAKFAATIIETEKEWSAFWKRMGRKEPAPLREGEVGVYISLGDERNSGYKPYIIGAVEKDGKLVVSYAAGKVSTSDFVVQGVTRPWLAAIIPRSKLPVVFTEMGK